MSDQPLLSGGVRFSNRDRAQGCRIRYRAIGGATGGLSASFSVDVHSNGRCPTAPGPAISSIARRVARKTASWPAALPARQVCLRSDSKAFVTASIANAGNYYHIELTAQDCRSGKMLAKVERETNARNQIVKTLGAAGHQLRRELGEPEDSLSRFNTPLENETSPSPDALHTFSQALRLAQQGNNAAAIP